MLTKLFDESGETLVETLCALLVITLAMLMLASALLSASRANAAFDANDVSFSTEGATSGGDSVVRFKTDGMPDVTADIELFETGAGYAYYDAKN